MASKEVWGPPLWRLLHSLAERLGRQTIPMMATDEKRAWVNLLKSVGDVMPCMACRTHYRAWCGSRPPERFASSYRLAEDARKWLWGLHDEVNRSRGVQSPPLEDIPGLYGSRKGHELTADFTAVCLGVAHSRELSPDALRNFKFRVGALRVFTG